jgi:NAD-reducing hydrogenase large subunit
MATTRQIVIDPVTRIEGHAKITLYLDDTGAVHDAHFHVTQFRGFEKLCEGRPFAEMPSLMARICGICPVSHLLASAKACDALLAVRVPPAAVRLRRVLNFAQMVQSHALSFFHLTAPDLLLGMDAPPEQRHLFALLSSHPEVARDGIRLRQFGQQIIEAIGGKRIHPSGVVAGGMSESLSAEHRDRILAGVPEALAIIERTLVRFKGILGRFEEEIAHLATFPTLFLALVGEDGEIEHYDGRLRVVGADGETLADDLDPARYADYIGEAVEPWTYMKFPYFKPEGYPEGIYRVGPLARLNVASRVGTRRAGEEWLEFCGLEGGAVLSSFHYHYARLIECLYAVERIEELLSEADALDPHVRAYAAANSREGVGVAEAPRGTLIHHYRTDDDGLVTWANLVIATGHNNLAMNRGVLQAAKRFVRADRLSEGMLNRVEAVIRAFDPCLSCSTHALGEMPLHVELRAADGTLLDEVRRPA